MNKIRNGYLNKQSFYNGLAAFSADSFPKKCEVCNKIYMKREDFLRDVQRGIDEQHNVKNDVNNKRNARYPSQEIELCCNCTCGSRLVCVTVDFRTSFNTEERMRDKFGYMLDSLEVHGIERDVARKELFKLIAGQPSKLIHDLAVNVQLINYG